MKIGNLDISLPLPPRIIESLGYYLYWHIENYYNAKNFFKNPTNIFSQYRPEANMICFPQEMNLPFKVLGADDTWLKAYQRMSSIDFKG